MKPAAAPHPSPDCLRLFGTGQLSADEAAGIEAHVSDCPECCEALRGVTDDPFAALVRRSTSASPSLPSPTRGRRVGVGGDTTPQFVSRLPEASCADSTFPEGSPAAPAIVEVPAELREHPRYQVLELLGHGGMGTVYKAEHRLMKRTVALKLLARNLTTRPELAERFVRETQTVGRLAHASIAQAFDAEQAGDTLFLVMEFVPGTDLARLVRERGPLPCIESCNYIRQAALALQHAHERGMVHRDIKPHNLMLTPSGEIKVLDFGLARFVLEQPLADTSQLTEEGLFMGTADYVAPEQARDAHQADIRADVYSLGCTLYHLLTDQVPFPAKTVMDKVVKHATEQPAALSALRPDLPPGLEGVVMKMMAKLPDQRYQTPGEVAEALAPYATAGVMAVRLAQPGRLGRTGTLTEAGLVREPAGARIQTVVLPASAGRSGRERWGRRLVAVAAGFLLVAMALAGVVVYRIQTDKGELVIKTVDDDVEVVVKQGGKVVTFYDPKTKQKLILRSGTYELELNGKPTGLKLVPDRVTLKRGDREIAKIEGPPDSPSTAPIREVRRFTGHTGLVCRVAFSSDGRRALSCGTDGSLRLWDVETAQQLREFTGHAGQVHNVVFSPDDRRALSAGWDGTVRLWDVDSGKEVRTFKGHGSVVFRAIFSPDGRRAFSTSQDGTLRVWNVESGKELRRFQAPVAQVGLAVSPDGRRVFGGGHGDTILRLWEVDGGKEPRRFEGHKERIPCVVFLPGGRRALSGSFDGTLRLWDLESGDYLRRFPLSGRIGEVEDVAVTPDGRRAVSASADGTVRLWDLESGRQLASFEGHKLEGSRPGDAGAVGCVISPDGRFALSAGADKTVRLLRLPDPPVPKDEAKPQVKADPPIIDPLHRIHGTRGMDHLSISRDGRYFVMAGADHPSISVFETQSGKRILSIALWRKRGALARFCSDSTQLITCEVRSDLRIYDLATGRQVRAFDTGEHMFMFSAPVGNRLVYGTPHGEQVWDWVAGKKLCDFRSSGMHHLTPDGRHVFNYAREKPHLRVLDATTGNEADAYPQLRALGRFGPLSSDGKRLLNWEGSKLTEYDVATGKEIQTVDVGLDKRIAYSGDHRRLLTIGKARDECRLLDVRTGKLLAVLHFPESVDPSWSTGALSDDGRYAVVIGPADSTYVFRLPDPPAATDRR